MGFEPQKFFIGLVDFFSIFLPGAVLAYLIRIQACSTSSPLCGSDWTVERGLIFLFASYLLGHLIFLISAVLDDLVYDPLRGLTEWGQIRKRLTRKKDLSPYWLRCLATSHLLFGANADEAVILAQRLKARALQALEGDRAVNAFQWCKARLTQEMTEGLIAVQRFEADSKFFRSFSVVLGLLTLIFAHDGRQTIAALCLAGTVLALWRYIDQRFKSTQQAYWLVITMEGAKNGPEAIARNDGLSHAGGVVYKVEGTATKFMLVGAAKNREERILPKGHIEPGEDPRETAVREIREETGNWTRIVDWLADRRLNAAEPDAPLVRWFLLESREEKDWRPEDRPRTWLPLSEAKDQASFPEIRELLDLAAAKLSGSSP